MTIAALIIIWFSHYKRLIASTLSNQCEITKEISQNKDHLSQSFSSKPQKNMKSEMESLKWELLKKSYPWRQESRVNHNGTAGHSVPRYYTTYERWAASLPNNQIKKDESLRNFHWCLIRTLHNYPFLADWKSINNFPLNELAGRQHKKLDLKSWYF